MMNEIASHDDSLKCKYFIIKAMAKNVKKGYPYDDRRII